MNPDNYGRSLAGQLAAKAQCEAGLAGYRQPTALETTEQRIAHMEAELHQLKRLKMLLENHPEVEEIVSLLGR